MVTFATHISILKSTNHNQQINISQQSRSKHIQKNEKGNWMLETLKKHSQFKKCENLKLWKFKVCTFENSECQNFKSAWPHINVVQCTWFIEFKKKSYIKVNLNHIHVEDDQA